MAQISSQPNAVKNTVKSLYRQGGLSKVASQYNSIIEQSGRRWGLSADFIKTAIFVESRGNRNAISPRGAAGLMQIMEATAKIDLNGIDRFDPVQNIRGGVEYYGRLVARYRGDLEKAVAAYNWGMGNVDKVSKKYGQAWRAALPSETKNYLAQYRHILNEGKPLM